jgi:hypothetical protein
MRSRSQIKRRLSTPSGIESVQNLLAVHPDLSRSAFANLVCRTFGFLDPKGREQRTGCLAALRALADRGHFVLPDPQSRAGTRKGRGSRDVLPEVCDFPERVDAVENLSLRLVETREDRVLWQRLMSTEHPQGGGPLVGRQLRYLIWGNGALVGGLGFASSAVQLADRDRWIGWDREQQRQHLDHVVAMSRFLIRPCIRCRNLASKVLSLVLEVFPCDFHRRYGFEPWLLESFIDLDAHDGACYRAANWIMVGKTKGRGRQDRLARGGQSIKAIYMRPLVPDFRARMGLAPGAGLGPLDLSDGLDDATWAAAEFGGAPLSDERLSQRLVGIANALGAAPGQSVSQAMRGGWKEAKAFYRLLEQDEGDGSAVTLESITAPHRARTIRRMQGQRIVLCIQDGSDLSYNTLDQCTGLGPIGTNQTGAVSRGLHLHSTFAVTTSGIPLGVFCADCEAPTPAAHDDRAAHEIPIEEKKTFVWIKHHRALRDMASVMPNTRLINVCDREADIFEFFAEQRNNPRVDLLVRAKHDRILAASESKLFQTISSAPVQADCTVQVPRQSARTKKSGTKARAKRASRTARLIIRFHEVQLKPPSTSQEIEPVTVTVIHAKEQHPPQGEPAVEWFLLTTIHVASADDAVQCLRWYCLRWRIEDWHRVLKSGCRIESYTFRTAERLRRAIAIHLVIAWRIMLMTLLGRATPQLPMEILFSPTEVRVLRAFAKKGV